MRSAMSPRWAARAARLACLSLLVLPARGDEPSRLGRLFRLGVNDPGKPAAAPANPAAAPSAGFGVGPGSSAASAPAAARSVADFYSGQPALSTPPTTPAGGTGLVPTPRIAPKPRINKGITDADPLVSRISVGRADGGSQFGMFIQVFADGTVIDGGGVHKVGPEALKPVIEAVSSGDFGKIKGHCGGPAGDTFENIHVVTYERAYGRLRANAFSYSGNPQGCDHAVHHLHKVLEDFQMKLDAPGVAAAAPPAAGAPLVASPPPAAANPAPAPALPPMSAGAPLGMPGLPDPGLH